MTASYDSKHKEYTGPELARHFPVGFCTADKGGHCFCRANIDGVPVCCKCGYEAQQWFTDANTGKVELLPHRNRRI